MGDVLLNNIFLEVKNFLSILSQMDIFKGNIKPGEKDKTAVNVEMTAVDTVFTAFKNEGNTAMLHKGQKYASNFN